MEDLSRAALMLGALLITLPSKASELTVGRWCDKPLASTPKLNNIMEIVVDADGKVILRTKFADGSSLTQVLDEVGNDVYAVVDSPTGDKYRIVPSIGSLQLLDDDGVIRSATRLDNTPQPRECID